MLGVGELRGERRRVDDDSNRRGLERIGSVSQEDLRRAALDRQRSEQLRLFDRVAASHVQRVAVDDVEVLSVGLDEVRLVDSRDLRVGAGKDRASGICAGSARAGCRCRRCSSAAAARSTAGTGASILPYLRPLPCRSGHCHQCRRSRPRRSYCRYRRFLRNHRRRFPRFPVVSLGRQPVLDSGADFGAQRPARDPRSHRRAAGDGVRRRRIVVRSAGSSFPVGARAAVGNGPVPPSPSVLEPASPSGAGSLPCLPPSEQDIAVTIVITAPKAPIRFLMARSLPALSGSRGPLSNRRAVGRLSSNWRRKSASADPSTQPGTLSADSASANLCRIVPPRCAVKGGKEYGSIYFLSERARRICAVLKGLLRRPFGATIVRAWRQLESSRGGDPFESRTISGVQHSFATELEAAVSRGAAHLTSVQRADGSWEGVTDLGPTGAAMYWIVERKFGDLPEADYENGRRPARPSSSTTARSCHFQRRDAGQPPRRRSAGRRSRLAGSAASILRSLGRELSSTPKAAWAPSLRFESAWRRHPALLAERGRGRRQLPPSHPARARAHAVRSPGRSSHPRRQRHGDAGTVRHGRGLRAPSAERARGQSCTQGGVLAHSALSLRLAKRVRRLERSSQPHLPDVARSRGHRRRSLGPSRRERPRLDPRTPATRRRRRDGQLA